jgi:YD repeat-containing protein
MFKKQPPEKYTYEYTDSGRKSEQEDKKRDELEKEAHI